MASFDNNSTWAREGDRVTLSFESDEKLQDVEVTMKSGSTHVDSSRITSADVVNNTDVNGNLDGTEKYSYSYVTKSDDDNGAITFTINYKDLANTLEGEEPNVGIPVTSAANHCYYDNVVPIIPVLDFSIDTSNNDYAVKFKFEEPVKDFTKEDVTVASETGTLGGVDNKDDLTSSEDGKVWTGKFYPKTGHIVTGGELSLDCTNTATTKCIFTDLAGNPVLSTAKSHYPTVREFVLQKNSGNINKLLEGETGTVKLLFSELVYNFYSNHDITVGSDNNGTPYGSLEEMTSDDKQLWTGTFTPAVNLDLGVSDVDILTLHNKYKDSDGNTGVSAKLAFILDTLPPTVNSISFSNHPTDGSDHPFGVGENISIEVEFSQIVVLSGTASTLEPTLVLNSGGTAHYVTDENNNNSKTIKFLYNVQEGESETDLKVTEFILAEGETILDLNGNSANISITDSISQTPVYAVDGVHPTVSITAKNDKNHVVTSGSTTNDAEVVLEFTLSEANTNFKEADIAVTNGVLSDFTQDINNTTLYTATFTPEPEPPSDSTTNFERSCRISVDEDAFTDAAGNGNRASNIFEWNHDSIHPTMTITSDNVPNGKTTNHDTIKLHFNASDSIGESEFVNVEDFDWNIEIREIINSENSGDKNKSYAAIVNPGNSKYIYIAAGNAGAYFVVMDITSLNESNGIFEAEYEKIYINQAVKPIISLAVHNNHLYLTDSNRNNGGIYIYNIETPETPTFVSSISYQKLASHEIAFKDDYVLAPTLMV